MGGQHERRLRPQDGAGAQAGLEEQRGEHQQRQDHGLWLAAPQQEHERGEGHDQQSLDAGDRAVAVLDGRGDREFGNELAVAQWPGSTTAFGRAGVGHRGAHDQHAEHAGAGRSRQPAQHHTSLHQVKPRIATARPT